MRGVSSARASDDTIGTPSMVEHTDHATIGVAHAGGAEGYNEVHFPFVNFLADKYHLYAEFMLPSVVDQMDMHNALSRRPLPATSHPFCALHCIRRVRVSATC